jgi:hypothetical protein
LSKVLPSAPTNGLPVTLFLEYIRVEVNWDDISDINLVVHISGNNISRYLADATALGEFLRSHRDDQRSN